MSFFEYISIKHLNEYRPCESWHNTLMFFSQTVPSVRHAAMALALMHRSYRAPDCQHSLPYSIPNRSPLFHYNRAIQLLLDQDTGNNIEAMAITLLVCYLFICFDHLARNYVQAMKHLRGGVELLRNMDHASLDRNKTPSGIRTLISQMTRQFRRLDMQAVTFLVDWTPADFQETPTPPDVPPVSESAFQFPDQAADQLEVLVARVMSLRNMEQQQQQQGSPATTPGSETTPATTSQITASLLQQLETWTARFSNMLLQRPPTTSPSPLIPLLHLQHTVSWILLSTCGAPDGEQAFDGFLPQFQQCLAWADEITMAHHEQILTPEVGIIPVLYIIGVKCRHPGLRREAVHILRRRSMREAVWDSIIAARVVERVMEIEEGGGMELSGYNTGGVVAREAGYPLPEGVPVGQRVEMVSWVHVVNSGGEDGTGERLEVTYTVCGREGACVESVSL